MTAEAPTILATTMGFHRGGRRWTPGPIFDFAFELARTVGRPRLCFVATAGGDQSTSISGFYGAFAGAEVQASHLTLFDMPNVEDVRGHLLSQDVIWIDRGSLVNLVAVWRAHGLDSIMRACWEAGVVLAGESAGSLCWHSKGVTDSYGPHVQAAAGLGLLPYGNAVHYRERRKRVHALMKNGALPVIGYATEAGAGLHYRGAHMVEAIADRPNAAAYRLEYKDGQVEETPLAVRMLR